VKLRSGEHVEKLYSYPPGHPQNPVSDADIERKLFELSGDVMPRSQAQRLIEAVWQLDRYEQIRDVAALLSA
jgi:2-methylcitrate dehydratase PrpD